MNFQFSIIPTSCKEFADAARALGTEAAIRITMKRGATLKIDSSQCEGPLQLIKEKVDFFSRAQPPLEETAASFFWNHPSCIKIIVRGTEEDLTLSKIRGAFASYQKIVDEGRGKEEPSKCVATQTNNSVIFPEKKLEGDTLIDSNNPSFVVTFCQKLSNLPLSASSSFHRA